MLSRLDPVFRNTFRQAEENDVRQHIPHEERRPPNKKDEGGSDGKRDREADSMEVSVPSLIAFLRTFMAEQMPELFNNSDAETSLAGWKRPPEQKRPTDTRKAKAVRAYQASARHSAKPPPPEAVAENQPALSSNVSEQDRRDLPEEAQIVLYLLERLHVLEKNGIDSLTIPLGTNIVDGLKRTIDDQFEE